MQAASLRQMDHHRQGMRVAVTEKRKQPGFGCQTRRGLSGCRLAWVPRMQGPAGRWRSGLCPCSWLVQQHFPNLCLLVSLATPCLCLGRVHARRLAGAFAAALPPSSCYIRCAGNPIGPTAAIGAPGVEQHGPHGALALVAQGLTLTIPCTANRLRGRRWGWPVFLGIPPVFAKCSEWPCPP